MKRFIGFIKKEFYHIFRDRRSLFILFGMPIAQILLFGFAITNEINNVDIAILDHSKDANTQEIINKISASKYFSIKQMIEREADIESVFQKGNVKAVLNFEKDFSQKLIKEKKATVQIITDATDPNTANTISNYVNAILQNYQKQLNKDITIAYQIVPETRMVYNPELKKCLYVCSWCYDHYFNVGFGNDDLHFHYQRKRIGHHGNFVSFAFKTISGYYWQSVSIYFSIHYKCYCYCYVEHFYI